MSNLLEFHSQIYNVTTNDHVTIATKLERIMNMMFSFNLPSIDEDLRKNKDKNFEALLTIFNEKKGNKIQFWTMLSWQWTKINISQDKMTVLKSIKQK